MSYVGQMGIDLQDLGLLGMRALCCPHEETDRGKAILKALLPFRIDPE